MIRRILPIVATLALLTPYAAGAQEGSLRWTPEKSMELRQVTGTAVAPDGLRIAFVVRVPVMDGEKSEYLSHVWIVNADGSGVVNLTNHPGKDGGATWSPDGQSIAFMSDRDHPRRELYVMRADGAEVRRLTRNELYEETPAWSPDGRSIAFTRQVEEPASTGHAGNGEIFLIAPDGTGERRLTNRDGFDSAPRWAPDGRRLAFHGPGTADAFDLFVIDADGTNLRNLTNDAADDYQPTWSPDGMWLAYCSGPGRNDAYDVWLIRPDGSGKRQLTTAPDRDQRPGWRPVAGRKAPSPAVVLQ